MSTWKLKGYVADSDDDEEYLEASSNRESQHASSPIRVERASSAFDSPKEDELSQHNGNNDVSGTQSGSPTPSFAPIGAAISTIIPTSTITLTPPSHGASVSNRDRTESPDILQACLNAREPSPKRITYSNVDNLGTPSEPHGSRNVSSKKIGLVDFGLENDDIFFSDDDLTKPPYNIEKEASENDLPGPPSDNENESSGLSEPPSDLEEEIAEQTAYASPKRNVRVQVLVQSPAVPSPAAESHENQQYQRERSFRQRRPEQLRPYLVEWIRYKDQLQRRGIVNVPRHRSPVRHLVRYDTDTQDLEFDPENAQDSMEQPETLVSSATTPKSARDNHQATIRRQQSLTPTRSSTLGPKTKKRKLTRKSSSRKSFENARPSESDIWSFPPSPPHASSPSPATRAIPSLMQPLTLSPEINLPTPSLSSSLRGDAPNDGDSDDDVVHPLRRSTQKRTPIHVSSDDPSTDDSEAEPSDSERRQVVKKIKGVLPASWIRMDKQKKNAKPSLSKELFNDSRPSDRASPQRGVAQKVIKNKAHTEVALEHRSQYQVPDTVSVESEDDDIAEISVRRSTEVQNHAQAAADLAAMLDKQYANDDSDTEDDRLHLFTLGGTSRKRKKQTKVTDTFTRAKKPRTSRNQTKKPTIPAARASGKLNHSTSRGSKRSPLPALSVLDMDMSPSSESRNVPDFLKVARRVAREKPDLARGSPTHKHIKLHRSRDTKDARETLEKWRSGALRQKAVARPSIHHVRQRAPLIDMDANQHNVRPISDAGVERPSSSNSKQAGLDRTQHPQPLGSLSSRLLLFRPGQSSTQTRKKVESKPQNPQRYRPGQLEGDEAQFKHTDRRFAFATGLRKVDQRYNLHHPANQTLENPMLARFLTNNETPLPPISPAPDAEKAPHPSTNKPRRRRKPNAQRIEVEAREYRQPSEPDIIEIFSKDVTANVPHIETKPVVEQNLLQGLGPYGTRYSTTFDVSLLKAGTFFHSTTFIGSEELRRALPNEVGALRNFDEAASYVAISHRATTIRCGPWDDVTFTQISNLFGNIWQFREDHGLGLHDVSRLSTNALQETSRVLRMLINYVAVGLSFLDPVDRRLFCTNLKQTIDSLFMHALNIDTSTFSEEVSQVAEARLMRMVTYLLVLTIQVHRITQHADVLGDLKHSLAELSRSMLRLVVNILLRKISQLGDFLEKNKRFAERENGIQDGDMLVESVVVCMQVDVDGLTFWDVVSQELAPRAEKVAHVKTLESLWATIFGLLPFVELDVSGTLNSERRTSFKNDNWSLVTSMLKQLFLLYPHTHRAHGISLNDYVRASLMRVHVLIKFWHWRRCDSVLKSIFDFFATNNLRLLRREQGHGSAGFLGDLPNQPSLDIVPTDTSFQIFLKCLALGLQGMRHKYSESKFRSMVFRLTPNHGRVYPKDQGLTAEDLDALRNHHDLLSTLYWASPPRCRPRLELIRGLVQHEHSHREACKLNVRTWVNLTAFQLSIREPYNSVQPFAEWHKDMMLQTLKQYRLAKTDLEEALKAGSHADSSAASMLVRQTVEKNQDQVLATLHECIAGMRRAVETGLEIAITENEYSNTTRMFLQDSALVSLLELPHLEDKRLVRVLRETLEILRLYAKLMGQLPRPEVHQSGSEESQDYGGSLDVDDIAQFDPEPSDATPTKPLEFIESALWRLLSNAFGAESAPDEKLLMECIDTWTVLSNCQVSMGHRTWSYFLDPFGKLSWQQLQRTEQKQKFGPYFIAAFIACNPAAYAGHEVECMTLLFSCLADRDSMLRFQHRLLQSIIRVDPTHPLLKNLPFFAKGDTNELDIDAETLRARRLSLISSLLANMHDDYHTSDSRDKIQLKLEYASILKVFMATMENNYRQLGQRPSMAGVYVEFVQKNVQFLQQYTADITPVDEFFTNSISFPTPSTDPTYVVGKLYSYAPKMTRPGVVKELSIFFQTVAQQAASHSQQALLTQQLKTVLGSDEAPTRDRIALRDALMQGIFPAYVEMAFSSAPGFAFAVPILQSLRGIVKAMIFDLRALDEGSIQAAYESIMSIVGAFIRSTDIPKGDAKPFKQAHVLVATRLMLETMMAAVPVLQYIYSRCFGSTRKPAIVKYLEELNVTIAQSLHGVAPLTIPSYEGDMDAWQCGHSAPLSFARNELKNSLQNNWSMRLGNIFIGYGQTQREVIVDIASVEEEKEALISRVEALHTVIVNEYDEDEDVGFRGQGKFLGHIHV
ncbi:hypothetical protein DM02DRAFT_617189 [Periconia macrospinosa]|uniref:Mus7/MMS22 family-domain-containing protein n=1 Tax=Periconia macrospinosa TaxID=97972 RepID=A0A2V1DEJ9_9PLEO|nr:hypothetical protein DM02DRAFT_617189 [Periconia macrospinosa]